MLFLSELWSLKSLKDKYGRKTSCGAIRSPAPPPAARCRAAQQKQRKQENVQSSGASTDSRGSARHQRKKWKFIYIYLFFFLGGGFAILNNHLHVRSECCDLPLDAILFPRRRAAIWLLGNCCSVSIFLPQEAIEQTLRPPPPTTTTTPLHPRLSLLILSALWASRCTLRLGSANASQLILKSDLFTGGSPLTDIYWQGWETFSGGSFWVFTPRRQILICCVHACWLMGSSEAEWASHFQKTTRERSRFVFCLFFFAVASLWSKHLNGPGSCDLGGSEEAIWPLEMRAVGSSKGQQRSGGKDPKHLFVWLNRLLHRKQMLNEGREAGGGA